VLSAPVQPGVPIGSWPVPGPFSVYSALKVESGVPVPAETVQVCAAKSSSGENTNAKIEIATEQREIQANWNCVMWLLCGHVDLRSPNA
jgi:hypothetical protein